MEKLLKLTSPRLAAPLPQLLASISATRTIPTSAMLMVTVLQSSAQQFQQAETPASSGVQATLALQTNTLV